MNFVLKLWNCACLKVRIAGTNITELLLKAWLQKVIAKEPQIAPQAWFEDNLNKIFDGDCTGRFW